MSWHFSQAVAAEFLAGSYLGGELFALWKSMPHAPDDSCSDKMKGTCHHSPYGIMFVPSEAATARFILMLYREASHVAGSVREDLVPGSPTPTVRCGSTKPESLARYDPDSHSWKTHQHSLLEEGFESLPILPAWGMTAGGELWELTPVDFPITEPECGWLPTPSGVNGGNNNTMGRVDEWGGVFQSPAWDTDWEGVISQFRGDRYGLADRLDRTDAIRNGQVPAVVRLAWETLKP